MHIIGTAGHVDHGKSALVRALTGTNPDRWLEEQLRGMTLDLGFAHLRLEDGVEAGIIDVPGHERFLHNMLAGAAGMELLLLVVAANEGPRPQTFEHLAILQYLNVRRVIVAVTKTDLLPEEELDAALTSVRSALRETIARDAATVPVSTVTGAGLQEVRRLIGRELRLLAPRDREAPPYLPIDRVFALPGHGTIVTGTLMQGTLSVGDQLLLAPSGKKVRIRSLQVFGTAKERVGGGARVAANIPSVSVSEIARGEVLASPQFEAATTFDVVFTPLEHALPILRRRLAVKTYIGSAELGGALVFERVPHTTESAPARLHLQRATIAYPGQSFVVRRSSPKTLLGGGVLQSGADFVDVGPLDAAAAQDASVRSALESASLDPLELPKIAARANVREEVAAHCLERLIEQERVVRVQRPPAYVAATHARTFIQNAIAALEANARAEPWSMGMTSLALSRVAGIPEPLLVRLLSAFVEEGKLAYRSGYYASIDHVPRLTAEQRDFFERAVAVDDANPSRPAALGDLLEQVKACAVLGLGKAFDTLVVQGALVKVGDDLYRGTQVRRIHQQLEQLLRKRHRITMAEFRDLIGTSRKHAVPLLEWFDARGITVRSGDYRMLRSVAQPGDGSVQP